MKLSRKWLNEFVTVDANDKDFAEAMTLSGSKVEGTEDLGAEISNVVSGRITAMERHPDSDHMWICQLDVGRDEPVQIVTGAWNIHVGDMVPVALHKAVLPGGASSGASSPTECSAPSVSWVWTSGISPMPPLPPPHC